MRFAPGFVVCALIAIGGGLAYRLYQLGDLSSNGPEISVRFVSEPAGATLVSADSRRVLGAAPLTLAYSVPGEWQSCFSYDGFRARWPDGSQVAVRSIELCPDGGREQEIKIAAPKAPRRRRSMPTIPSLAPDGAVSQVEASSNPSLPLVPLSGAPESRPVNAADNPARPPAAITEMPPQAVRPQPRPVMSAATKADRRIPVQVVGRGSNETGYSFVVPGYISTKSQSYANCFGSADASIRGQQVGDFYYGTYAANARANCSGSGSSLTTVRPPEEVSYSVTGATFSLRIPDGRIAVVNCASKLDWTGVISKVWQRSCRVPTTDQFEAEFNGDKAKLFWRIGIRGEKAQSETYQLVEILEPVR